MNEYAVFAEGLVRKFDEVKAVDSVDLSVSEGEIYGFLGPRHIRHVSPVLRHRVARIPISTSLTTDVRLHPTYPLSSLGPPTPPGMGVGLGNLVSH